MEVVNYYKRKASSILPFLWEPYFMGHQTADEGVPVYRVTPANKFRGNGCKYWIGHKLSMDVKSW